MMTLSEKIAALKQRMARLKSLQDQENWSVVDIEEIADLLEKVRIESQECENELEEIQTLVDEGDEELRRIA